MPEIVIVNLPQSSERRAQISAQLNRLGLPFHFFSAIDGRTQGNHPLMQHYNAKLSIQVRGRKLSAGQLGCFASHYLLWQECVTKQQSIIVLEDDAIVDDERFKAFYQVCDQFPTHMGFIRLHQHRRKSYRSQRIFEQQQVCVARFNKGHMGTIGYYLTPTAAASLLKHANTWYLPVDIYMDHFWIHKVDSYGLEPPCLCHDDEIESEIGYSKKHKHYTLAQKVRREMFNGYNLLARHIHNLKFYFWHRTLRK
ncbi:glycosyltransferase family 25 protein [Motilimonas eburnea]|uniref:glycosyltransferase family 25 protein n=1 Tax=Motilimonas eburnea TaxID=1737488 RepID=UPI001E5985BC|nr:glycosyltransferase family 25 protein [Motilimonas eburnea]MCE2572621.1 glycosyltransferase family 25 protein [Motilimonas eburnea]